MDSVSLVLQALRTDKGRMRDLFRKILVDAVDLLPIFVPGAFFELAHLSRQERNIR